MDRMEEAPVRPCYGQEEDQEAVESLSSLMMIREVGQREVGILVRVVGVSCRTMQAEGLQAVAGMMAAAHLVLVVGF